MFVTKFTTYRDMNTDWYSKWQRRHSLADNIHRKNWEIAIVSELLESNGVLRSGKRGVGFGCGSESLAAYIASCGPQVLATDLLQEDWKHIHQGFKSFERSESLELRVVDMNWLQGESGVGAVEIEHFDFSWSVCSMDHCGSTWLTKRFLLNQMNCLRPGGIAVHTAEYTISSGLPRSGPTSWMDWSDIVDVQKLCEQLGHECANVDWNIGDTIEDHIVDLWPYTESVHLKPEVNAGRWGTCVVFTLKRGESDLLWVPVEEDRARAEIDEYQRSHSQT